MRHQIYQIGIVICYASLWSSVSSSTLVCNEVRGDSSQGHQVQVPLPLNLGPRGERGIPGEQGLRGPRGPQGEVDYDRVGVLLGQKIDHVVGNIKIQLSSEFGIEAPREYGDVGAGCVEDFYYRGKCYSLPHLSTTHYMTYVGAISACERHGASLAEIHDQAQQAALEEYVRASMSFNATVAEVWIGMTFVSANSALLHRSGKEIPSNRFEWHSPAFPIGRLPVSVMAMNVKPSEEAIQGLWTPLEATEDLQGVICERDF